MWPESKMLDINLNIECAPTDMAASGYMIAFLQQRQRGRLELMWCWVELNARESLKNLI